MLNREEALGRMIAPDELHGHVVIAHDRAGDELREQDDVEHVVMQAARALRGAAVDVHEVADLLEGEERDADGEDHARPAHGPGAAGGEQGIHLVDKEVRVLEVEQGREVQDHAQGQERLAPPLGQIGVQVGAEPVVDRRGGQQYEDESRRAPGVEEAASQQGDPVPVADRAEVVGQQEERHELEDEDE